MNQQRQHSLIHTPVQQESKLVQIGDRFYQITEVSQLSQNISSKTISDRSSLWDEPLTLIGFGCAAVLFTGLITALVMKVFFVPAPVPAAPPVQPQTVIVQPSQPEKKPYTRRDCRPAGLFGWGQDCQEERGYE